MTVANAITSARIGLVPILLALAAGGWYWTFVACLAVSLVSDIVDGKIARHLGQTSELGTRLDSWADLATFAAVPFCAWWLKPEVLRAERGAAVVILAAWTVPILIGLARWGRLTSYHTTAVRAAAYALGGSILLAFAGGPPWILRMAAAVAVLAEVEEVAITLTLPAWQANVRSWQHARAIRRTAREA